MGELPLGCVGQHQGKFICLGWRSQQTLGLIVLENLHNLEDLMGEEVVEKPIGASDNHVLILNVEVVEVGASGVVLAHVGFVIEHKLQLLVLLILLLLLQNGQVVVPGQFAQLEWDVEGVLLLSGLLNAEGLLEHSLLKMIFSLNLLSDLLESYLQESTVPEVGNFELVAQLHRHGCSSTPYSLSMGECPP